MELNNYIKLLMKRIILFTVFSLLIVSCNVKNDNEKDKKGKNIYTRLQKLNDKYLSSKSFYKDNFVNHFPKKLDSNYITYTECVSPEGGLMRLDLICKLGKSGYDIFRDSSKAIYLPGDTCLLIANRFANNKNYSYNILLSHEDSLKISRVCYQNELPVPNFWSNDYTTDSTDCKLPKDFEIFVLDAKPGKFLDDKYLTDGRYMPKEWKNGYSRGVAISKKRDVIIYWLIIW